MIGWDHFCGSIVSPYQPTKVLACEKVVFFCVDKVKHGAMLMTNVYFFDHALVIVDIDIGVLTILFKEFNKLTYEDLQVQSFVFWFRIGQELAIDKSNLSVHEWDHENQSHGHINNTRNENFKNNHICS